MPLIDLGFVDTAALQRLYELVAARSRQKPVHKQVVDWMVLGPDIGRIATDGRLREPSHAEFTALARLVELQAPELRPLLDYLVWCCPSSGAFGVQKLVETDEEWGHPSQILDRPRPSMEKLFTAYLRRAKDGDRTPAFRALRERVEFAATLEKTASMRRRKRRAAVKDARVKVGAVGGVARWILVNLKALSKVEIVAALEGVGISARPVDSALRRLGARTEGRDSTYRLVSDPRFEPQRQAVRFILEQVDEGTLMLSELAPLARREAIAKRTFIAACEWILEAVEPEATAKELGEFASTCWDGAAI